MPPHSSPEMRSIPSATENTCFGSSYLLSRVHVYHPVRSRPLKRAIFSCGVIASPASAPAPVMANGHTAASARQNVCSRMNILYTARIQRGEKRELFDSYEAALQG